MERDAPRPARARDGTPAGGENRTGGGSTRGDGSLRGRIRRLVVAAGRRLRRWLVAETLPVLYYRHLYGRDGAVARLVGRLVRRMERRWRLADAPMPPEQWNRDYRRGRWDYMARIHEAPRYAVVAGYVRTVAPGGDVLDVGCGEGLLFDHLDWAALGSYTGLDVSAEAVRRAEERVGDAAAFHVADASTYRPEGRLDAVVFNEVLYYLDDPLDQVRRYADRLREEGVVIVSTFHGSPRALAILRRIKAELLPLEAEATATSAGNTWTCSLFRPSS